MICEAASRILPHRFSSERNTARSLRSLQSVYLDKGSCLVDLAPESNFQLAQADMLANVIGDLETMLSEAFNMKDPDSKVISIFGLYCTVCR